MSIIVNTNVESMVAQKNLTQATNGLNKATTRLSTGLRINNAADDAAGLYIATNLQAQISGLEQCKTNISLGLNVLSIAEGDLTTIQNNIMRIKDLATQAASGTYSSSARNAIADEIDARVQEINRVAGASNFNGIKLFSSSGLGANGLVLHVGNGSDTDTEKNNSITVASSVFSAADNTNISLSWDKDTSVKTVTAANTFISTCETALTNITNRRTAIGVAQSRLEMAGEGLSTTLENVSAAKSTIMDTDVASEVATYTRQQILQQITTSILTQANQSPSIALSLLQ